MSNTMEQHDTTMEDIGAGLANAGPSTDSALPVTVPVSPEPPLFSIQTVDQSTNPSPVPPPPGSLFVPVCQQKIIYGLFLEHVCLERIAFMLEIPDSTVLQVLKPVIEDEMKKRKALADQLELERQDRGRIRLEEGKAGLANQPRNRRDRRKERKRERRKALRALGLVPQRGTRTSGSYADN